MSNDDIDYGLKLVLGLREEYDEMTPRKANYNGLNHVYSFNGGIGENLPTRDEGSFDVPGMDETVDYTLNDVNGPLLRMSHSFDEIDRALSSGSPFL